MSKGNNKVLGMFQKLGKAMMTPVAVMPAAAILNRLGAADVLDLPWMAGAGAAIFDNLAIIFAVGIAIGLAKQNNGTAGLAAVVGYFTITNVATSFDKSINMGVLAGIIVGILTGYLYNKFNDIQLPEFLGFFGGKRFVPIITSVSCLILGVVAGFVWPSIQGALDTFGNEMAAAGAIGAFVFGLLNRLLLPFGLHHVFNSIFWFQFGSYPKADGTIVYGDIARFFAGDPTAGTYMSGFFFIMMFALPAACFAMILAAKKSKRKAVTGMFLSIALTAFLTGITEPIEFTFMFLAPVLYVFHALMTGIALAVASILGIKLGFGFSAGLTDYLLGFGISTKPILAIGVGLIFAAIYFVVFYLVIKKFNLKTPGREDDEDDDSNAVLANNNYTEVAKIILEGLGGPSNITSIDNCITRLRLEVKDSTLVNEKKIKSSGISGVIRPGKTSVQVIVGTQVQFVADEFKKLCKSKNYV